MRSEAEKTATTTTRVALAIGFLIGTGYGFIWATVRKGRRR